MEGETPREVCYRERKIDQTEVADRQEGVVDLGQGTENSKLSLQLYTCTELSILLYMTNHSLH